MCATTQTDTMTWESFIKKHNWVKLYCTKYLNFRVKCGICEKEIIYVITSAFMKHIKNEHKEIFTIQNSKKQYWYCTFVMLTKQEEIECIFCHKIIPKESLIKRITYNNILKIFRCIMNLKSVLIIIGYGNTRHTQGGDF